MEPELQALGVRLAEVAARNTASTADRITAAKTKKQDQNTIALLDEIVSGLIDDKAELLQIAQAYQGGLVAQQMAESDLRYNSTHVVPLFKAILAQGDPGDGRSVSAEASSVVQIAERLLSVETVKVLQLIGFNFKRAIGEPLTEVCSQRIRDLAGPGTTARQGGQRASQANPRQ